jgi:nucleoside 2-deoxyribosyltransferase
LTDVRAELRRHLEDNAFIVRLSDDYDSAFRIEPTDDSIRSCLNNVDHADAVICIIDRRYGPTLPVGEFEGKSATHAEVLYAERLRKPVFIFIRDKAFQEYGQLRRNPNFDSKWVAGKNKTRWTEFVKSRVELQDRQGTNWYDEFSTSIDLKARVLKRLLDHFPEHVGALALRPDRLVRLYFIYRSTERTSVGGRFQNGGIGPALNIEVGFDLVRGTQPVEEMVTLTQSGLAEKEFFQSMDLPDRYRFELEDHHALVAKALFCRYENRFGDRYKVSIPLHWRDDRLRINGNEQFFVAPKGPAEPHWIRIR